MSNSESVPNHHNIFVTPEATTYANIPIDFANRQYSALEAMPACTDYNHRYYVRALIGDDNLERFYNTVAQAIMFHAEDASQVEPLGFRSQHGEFILGRAHRSQPTFRLNPVNVRQGEYALFTPIAGTFRTSFDPYPSAFVLDQNKNELIEYKPETSQVQFNRLEHAEWEQDGSMAHIKRTIYSTVIAVGREAVELMPELKNAELANAYDRFLETAVQKI